MKLILAIVQHEDSTALAEELTKNKINVTKLASTGGFESRKCYLPYRY